MKAVGEIEARLRVGDRVRIAPEHVRQFTPRATTRDGTVTRVRDNGILVVSWDGLCTTQVFASRLLILSERAD